MQNWWILPGHVKMRSREIFLWLVLFLAYLNLQSTDHHISDLVITVDKCPHISDCCFFLLVKMEPLFLDRPRWLLNVLNRSDSAITCDYTMTCESVVALGRGRRQQIPSIRPFNQVLFPLSHSSMMAVQVSAWKIETSFISVNHLICFQLLILGRPKFLMWKRIHFLAE